MPGASRVGVDSAGGTIIGNLAPTVITNGAPAAVLGAAVQGHGKSPHSAPVMAEASPDIFAHGIARCRAGDAASCGHPASGSPNVLLNESFAIASERAAQARHRAAVASRPAPPSACPLDAIPQIMSPLFPVGAALLAEWLARPASTDRASAAPVMVPLAWVLGHSEARSAWDDLAAHLDNAPAQAALASLLSRRGLLVDGAAFDFTLGDIRALPDAHYQSRSVSAMPGTDLYAALGAFSLRANAAGRVALESGALTIHVERVVCYLHDSFEFSGDQILGLLPSLHSECILLGNDDFRAFRAESGRGGDFYVFTAPMDVGGAFSFTP